MDYLLQVKIAALVGLLLLTLLFGFIPTQVTWFRNANGSETQRVVLSLLSCFAGGVFLAACLLDIIPDYLTDINAELQARQVQSSFPIPEFIIAVGFFTVLILERLVLQCQERRAPPSEREPLLQGQERRAPPSEQKPLLQGQERRAPPSEQEPLLQGNGHGESSEPHVHVDFQAHSPFRSFVLFLSLSLHSLFEGLSIGLQKTDSKVLQICLAILVHKSIMVFSLGLKLVQSGLRGPWPLLFVGVFSVMSPLGIGMGIAVMEAQLSSGALLQALLEGVAAGTFIYITFLEILPHELNSAGRQLLKVLFLLLGFGVMAALSFLG